MDSSRAASAGQVKWSWRTSMDTSYHLAQINIGRMRAPLEDPVMAGFMARLDEINALADANPGFVWRLQTDAGNATALRPFDDDDRIIINFSVWRSLEHLREFVFKSRHVEVLRQREQWFEKFERPYLALWWVPAGQIPTVAQAVARVKYLQAHGVSRHAFNFQKIFAPGEQAGVLAASE